jgi:thiosulfate reductase cytochrome b subunit
MTMPDATANTASTVGRDVQLHPLVLRIMHWLNALAILVMIGSGWRIYNWYPALPSNMGFPIDITLGGDPALSAALHNEDGLASALAWHFAGIWLLVINFVAYLIYGFASGHFRRDFLPVSVRSFARDFFAAVRGKLDHRLGRYNVVQKVFYWGVMLAILVTILSGLSIWKPVQFQELTWLFGGYEFARVVHFFGMASIVAFLVVHIALTLLVPKTLVAMVLGRASSVAPALKPEKSS